MDNVPEFPPNPLIDGLLKARTEGIAAKRADVHYCDNPYPPGSDFNEQWWLGWSNELIRQRR